MELIEKNDALFELVQNGKIRIRDCVVSRFNIFLENRELCIEMDFKYFERESFRIRFSGVTEYCFYHNSNYTFYIIEAFRILRDSDLYYITFDPEDEKNPQISENDNDFIRFKNFEAYTIAK
ncbi:MAG TPA: hypothetical protein VGM63_17635 [Mucilaginibacter sp.]|jgi:hypothetical protein